MFDILFFGQRGEVPILPRDPGAKPGAESPQEQQATSRTHSMKKMMQGAAALIALVGAGESMALEWMSNSVGFRYGQQFTNPNNP
ncbi:hypothetical protein V3R04_25470, partial [Escherichia coli]|uniref:hypothetical protein n=3 Tax=Gammaproteobacteria TaxID=1236 RepID=UPI002F3060D8